MSATRLLVISCLAAFSLVAGASGIARWTGRDLDLSSAAIAFGLASVAIGIACRALASKDSAWRTAPLAGPGIAAIALAFAAFQATSAFSMLLGSFVFGVALCLYALLNDLDQQVKPGLILACAMTELMAIAFLVR